MDLILIGDTIKFYTGKLQIHKPSLELRRELLNIHILGRW
jgi:hypothetical protein